MCSSNEEYKSLSSIALFLPTLTPGGIERCMLNLASGFIQQGVNVDLIVADYRGDFISKIPDDTAVVDLGVDRVLKSILPLREYLTNTEPDVLLVGHTHANIAAVIAGKMSRTETTVAIGVHNTHSLSASTSQNTKSKIKQQLYRQLYVQADQVIAVSNGAKKYTVNHTPLTESDISVIYNPVVTKELYAEASQSVEHRWINDDSIQVILGAGRLVDQKDFETLLRAFGKVIEKNSQARLLIAGAGPKEQELENLQSELGIRDQVELVGYLDNLSAYMNAADLFVLSSESEGFGIVLVEAMAVGTPVVSTDCPHGPSEILKNGEYGQLVDVGDEEAMASSIRYVLSNKYKPKRVEERAKEFTVSKIANKYLNTLLTTDSYK